MVLPLIWLDFCFVKLDLSLVLSFVFYKCQGTMKQFKMIHLYTVVILLLLTVGPMEALASSSATGDCSSALETSPPLSSWFGSTIPRLNQSPRSDSIADEVLSPRQRRLKSEWNRLSEIEHTDRQAIKKQTARVIRESKAVLSEIGVEYEVDPENPLILLISIPAGRSKTSHTLNRLAYSLSRNMRIKIKGQTAGKPLRVEINPMMLKNNNAGALFDENLSRLTLANDIVILGKIDDMAIHELRHAYSFYTQANGVDHDFTAYISYSQQPPPIHETYPHAFSVDELPAYIKQVLTQLRMAKRNHEVIANALDFAKTGLTLAQAMNRPGVSMNLLAQLQSLRHNPKVWGPPHWTEINIDNEEQKVWAFNHLQNGARIYFYETPILEGQSSEVPLIVTHAVIEQGDYKIDMNTLERLTIDKLDTLTTTIETKISTLMARGQQIESGLKNSISALERPDSPDLSAAIDAIESALDAIKIKN
jgi:hypothetical protein